jgi:NTP pyrophosphatase (non-canonical NTP hydrolase)
MTFDEYQQKAAEFAVYPKDREREYLSLGLISEVGELAGKLKKEIRDGVDLTEAILDEASDVMWYAAMTCTSFNVRLERWWATWPTEGMDMPVRWMASFASLSTGFRIPDREGDLNKWAMGNLLMILENFVADRGTTLEAVCEANIAKLTDRKNRGKLQGSGDTR